ncbi:MAG: DUF1828 domain-containing protein [Thermoplasmata archaeon]|nr:DUF1828 domain-containing protein [Thermoplasmata archaeon]MCK4455132.1 DUF1828 domain-containing protein [Thermoplasmata archaeon]
MVKCKELVREYLSFLEGEFTVEETEYGCLVHTPFIGTSNDLIEFAVMELPDGRIRLTDLGETIATLALKGIEIEEGYERYRSMMELVEALDLSLSEDTLQKDCSTEEVGSALNSFIAGIYGISYLEHIGAPAALRAFQEEVRDFLDRQKVTCKPNHGFRIEKVPYHIDFSLYEDELYLQTFHTESRERSRGIAIQRSYPFLSLRLQKTRPKLMSIIDDRGEELVWTDPAIDIISAASDDVGYWTRKEDFLEDIQEFPRRNSLFT